MKVKEMILTYTESRSGGEAMEPGEKWTNHEPEYIDWHPLHVFIDEPGKSTRSKTNEWQIECLNCADPVEVGDTIHVLTIRYRTGGTFGTTHGAWHIEGAYKDEKKARSIADQIEKDEAAYRAYRFDYRRRNSEKAPEDKYVSPHGYKCWRGHFEALEDVQVESFTVL